MVFYDTLEMDYLVFYILLLLQIKECVIITSEFRMKIKVIFNLFFTVI